MTETITKQSVLDVIDDERAEWDALIAKIDPARMEQPDFTGGWTFKDIVAHITDWRLRSIARLEAAARGEPEPPDPWPAGLEDDDEINAWFYARDRDLPLSQVLQEAAGSFVRLRLAVEELPEEALTDPNWFPWLEGDALGPIFLDRTYFDHFHEEHEADIRAWLAAPS